jgi:hypothetical protein
MKIKKDYDHAKNIKFYIFAVCSAGTLLRQRLYRIEITFIFRIFQLHSLSQIPRPYPADSFFLIKQ